MTDAVITVPAYFNDAERHATKEAGEIAGLNVLRIINEPTAAALAWPRQGQEDELILVFDLGVAHLRRLPPRGRQGPRRRLRDDPGPSTSGDNRLGGDDWDERIVDHLLTTVKNTTGMDLAKDKIAMQRLRDAAEQDEEGARPRRATNISLQYLSMGENGPIHLDETLTRAQFER